MPLTILLEQKRSDSAKKPASSYRKSSTSRGRSLTDSRKKKQLIDCRNSCG